MVMDNTDLVVGPLTLGDSINQLPHQVLEIVAAAIIDASKCYMCYHCSYKDCLCASNLMTHLSVLLALLLRQRWTIHVIDTHALLIASWHNTCIASYIDGHA